MSLKFIFRFLQLFFLLVFSLSIFAKEKEKSEKSKTKLYGFAKMDIGYADKAALSYGNNNLTAPTMAKRRSSASDNSPRWVGFPGPSRIGLIHSFHPKVKGVIELDFMDFSLSNGNVNTRPRVRQLFVSYKPNRRWEIFGGQFWDIFSPLNSHTFNTIALFFETGNIGWQRSQFGFGYKLSKKISFKTALGVVGKNTLPGPKLGIELNSTPTLSGQLQYKEKKFGFYLSALTVDMKVRQPLIDSNRDGMYLEYDVANSAVTDPLTYPLAYRLGGDGITKLKSGGYSFGFVTNPTRKFEFKAELNYGSNFADLNALGISRAENRTYAENLAQSQLGVITSNDDFLNSVINSQAPIYYTIYELGGWVSFNHKINSKWEWGLHYAATKILNQEDLTGANESKLFISQAFSSTQWTNTELVGGTRENSTLGGRLSYSPLSRLKYFLQLDYVKTFYANQERYEGILAHIESINISTNEITLREPGYAFLKSSGFAAAKLVRAGVMYMF